VVWRSDRSGKSRWNASQPALGSGHPPPRTAPANLHQRHADRADLNHAPVLPGVPRASPEHPSPALPVTVFVRAAGPAFTYLALFHTSSGSPGGRRSAYQIVNPMQSAAMVPSWLAVYSPEPYPRPALASGR